MEPLQSVPVPRHLDDRPRVFFWDAEVAMVFVTCFAACSMGGRPLIGLFVGFAGALARHRALGAEVPGHALHNAYWHIGGLRLKRTPPSSMRRFTG